MAFFASTRMTAAEAARKATQSSSTSGDAELTELTFLQGVFDLLPSPVHVLRVTLLSRAHVTAFRGRLERMATSSFAFSPLTCERASIAHKTEDHVRMGQRLKWTIGECERFRTAAMHCGSSTVVGGLSDMVNSLRQFIRACMKIMQTDFQNAASSSSSSSSSSRPGTPTSMMISLTPPSSPPPSPPTTPTNGRRALPAPRARDRPAPTTPRAFAPYEPETTVQITNARIGPFADDIRRLSDGATMTPDRAELVFVCILRRCIADCTQVRLFYESGTRYGDVPWSSLKIAEAVQALASLVWLMAARMRVRVVGVL